MAILDTGHQCEFELSDKSQCKKSATWKLSCGSYATLMRSLFGANITRVANAMTVHKQGLRREILFMAIVLTTKQRLFAKNRAANPVMLATVL